jgi:hypothetical protein
VKKKRNRAKVRATRDAIERTAQSFEKAGIRQDRLTIRIGGRRPERWQRPKETQTT